MSRLTKEGEDNFGPLIQAVERVYPDDMGNFYKKYIVGPHGENVPLEVRKSNDQKLDINGDPVYPIGFVGIGDLAIIDSQLKKEIAPSLLDEYTDSLIWIHDGNSIFWDFTHLQYSPLAAYSLMTLDLTGKHVLDLGSADGILSLIARKRGAAQVTSVEINPHYKQFYSKNLDANELDSEGMKYIMGSFKDLDVAQKVINSSPDITVANIGPYYGRGHLEAIKLATQAASLETYIDGAFIKDPPRATGIGKYSPAPSIELLASLGFSNNYREVTHNKWCLAYMVDRSTIEFN